MRNENLLLKTSIIANAVDKINKKTIDITRNKVYYESNVKIKTLYTNLHNLSDRHTDVFLHAVYKTAALATELCRHL